MAENNKVKFAESLQINDYWENVEVSESNHEDHQNARNCFTDFKIYYAKKVTCGSISLH